MMFIRKRRCSIQPGKVRIKINWHCAIPTTSYCWCLLQHKIPYMVQTYFVLFRMNGVGENTFDAPSVVAGVIFMSPICTITSLDSAPNDAILLITNITSHVLYRDQRSCSFRIPSNKLQTSFSLQVGQHIWNYLKFLSLRINECN